MARVPGGFGIDDVMGVRRPDRSVSLGYAVPDLPLRQGRYEVPDVPLRDLRRLRDVREQPVQRMGGGFFNWSGYGNPPEIWTRGPTGPSWNITSNAEAQRFLEAAAEQMRRDDRDDAPPPDAPLEEIIGPVYDYLGKSPRHIALPEGGGIDDNVPEPGEGEAVDPVRDPEPVYDPGPDTGPMLMAGEGKRPWEFTEAEKRANRQREIDRRGMEQIRKDQAERERRRTGPDQQSLNLEARGESSPLGWLGGRAAEREGRQTYEPGPSKRAYPGAPLTPREPVGDPQSQMSQQFLADRFAQQAAQPQQGYFGGLGQAVGGMSTQQKIALLVGLGLLPFTGGASSSMMGPALGVGAGLAFTQ